MVHPVEEVTTVDVSLWGTTMEEGFWSKELVVRETAGGTGLPGTTLEALGRTSPEDVVAGGLLEGDCSTVSMVCPKFFICPGWLI